MLCWLVFISDSGVKSSPAISFFGDSSREDLSRILAVHLHWWCQWVVPSDSGTDSDHASAEAAFAKPRSVSSHVVAPQGTLGTSFSSLWPLHHAAWCDIDTLVEASSAPHCCSVPCYWLYCAHPWQLWAEQKCFAAGMAQKMPTWSMEHAKQWCEPWCTAALHGTLWLPRYSMLGLLPRSTVQGSKAEEKKPNPHHSLQVNIHCFLCDHLTLPGWSLRSSNAMGSHVRSLLHPSSHPLPPLLPVFFSFLTLLVFCLFSPSIFPSSSRSHLILPHNTIVKKWWLVR